jgi:hypothetical protein
VTSAARAAISRGVRVRAPARRGALGLAVALLVGGLAAPPGMVRAGDAAPAATATPALALSDRPPLGCCCIFAGASPAPHDCSFGLHEDRCRSVGRLFPQRTTTWAPGRCPSP